MKGRVFTVGCVAGILVQFSAAAEMRTWMSRKGGTLEAELRSCQPTQVVLVGKDSKEVKLKPEDLSLADRLYLIEVGGADASIITSGKPGQVEKEARIDTSAFTKPEAMLVFPEGPSEGFEILETPHFLVATAGKIRPQALAETAERMWHGMAFDHMSFRQDWGDQRMLILAVEDRAAYKDLGRWYANYLTQEGAQEAAQDTRATWEKTGSTRMSLPDDMTEKHKLQDVAIVFNVEDASSYRKSLGPFPTHSIAGALLSRQMGGVSSYGSEGYFAIVTGHAFYKEISLAGKSETRLLSVDGTGKDEISSKSGFDDGSSWARSLRSLVRSGKVGVELEPMLKWKSAELTPERLVLIYSFAHYMQSDSKRIAAFSKMIRRIESSNQIPAPQEIASIFGFDSVAALETDWKAFIIEGDFR